MSLVRAMQSCVPTLSRGRATRALFAGLLMATGCTGSHAVKPRSPAGPTAPEPPVIAYATSHTVALADARGHSTVMGNYSPGEYGGPPVDHLTWSPDRRSIIWVAKGTLYRVAAAAPTPVDSWVCACTGAGFVDGRLATVETDGSRMLLFPPTGSGPPRSIPLTGVRLRTELGLPGTADVLTGMGRYLVISLYGEGTIDSTMYRVDGTGRVSKIHGVGWREVSEGLPGPGLVAAEMTQSNGSCYNVQSIGVIDPVRARLSIIPQPAPFDQNQYVLGYGWGADGSLYASLAAVPVQCSKGPMSPNPSTTTPGHLWRLTGARWVATGRSAFAGWPGPAGSYASITGTTTTDDFGPARKPGHLRLTLPGGRTVTLSDDAYVFAFPPS